MKKLIALTMLLIFTTSVLNALTGSGTENDPYQITNLTDLRYLSETPSLWDDNSYFIQTSDIDASDTQAWNSGAGFNPIGSYSSCFKGNYDGQDFSISFLTSNRPDESYIGLFGVVYNSIIENISIISIQIAGNNISGALAGSAGYSTLSNCHITGSITCSGSFVGGLLGNTFTSSIDDCSYEGVVNGANTVGGLIGRFEYSSEINYCSTFCNVSGGNSVGGLVGSSTSSNIANSSSIGVIVGNDKTGGLVGENNSTNISFSNSESNINGNDWVGGLVGYLARSSMNHCYASGDITGDTMVGGLIGAAAYSCTMHQVYSNGGVSGYRKVGGLIGVTYQTSISNSYSHSNTSSSSFWVGGLIGNLNESTLTNCYSIGHVIGQRGGGLVGEIYSSTASNSFWDVNTSGISVSALGVGLNTLDMNDIGSYENWDITENAETIWNIEITVNNGYPHFSWQIFPNSTNFTSSSVNTIIGIPITFHTLSSSGATAWEWDFNSDGIIDSTEENPTWVYSQVGDYDVTLTTWWGEEWETELKENYISIVAPLDYGLVAYYPFNGNANDESGNGNHAQILGNPILTNDFITLGNNNQDGLSIPYTVLYQLTDFSISVHVKLNNLHTTGYSPTNTIISGAIPYPNDNSFLIDYIKNNSQLRASINSTNYFFSNTDLEDLDWHIVSIVRENDKITLYLDELCVGFHDNAISTPLNINANSLVIGQDQDNINLSGFTANQSLAGSMKEFRIYNRALSEQEILALYNENQQNQVSVLSGQVTDNEDNPIPQASISLTASNTNLEVFTNEDGYYTFSALTNNQVNLYVSKEGHQSESRTMSLESGFNSANFTLTEVNTGVITSLELTDDLILYADNIVESPTNYYTASGNVNINNTISFGGQVQIDKRANLEFPLISGSGGLETYFPTQDSDAYVIVPNYIPYEYVASEKELIPNEWAYLFEGTQTIGGYNYLIGKLTFDETETMGKYTKLSIVITPNEEEDGFFADLMDSDNWFDSDNPPYEQGVEFDEISGSIFLSENEGVELGCNIQNLEMNMATFYVHLNELSYDPALERFYGNLEMRIPPENTFDDLLEVGDYSTTTVIIHNEETGRSYETNLESFSSMARSGVWSYFQLNMDLEFLSGHLNALHVSVEGFDIPVFNTGTYIRQISGSIEDLAVNDLKITATVDIGPHSSLDIPGVGPAFYLDDFGVTIKPWNYFEGYGNFKIFNNDVAGGKFYYKPFMGSVGLEGNFNLRTDDTDVESTIISGMLAGNVREKHFDASMDAQIMIPGNLPWYLDWCEGENIASSNISINDFTIATMIEYGRLSIAQKIEFGKTTAPWFHYYLGTNYNRMFQLWKGSRDGRYTIDFTVPENSKQFLVVAGNDLNLFDFILIDPEGNIYDNSSEGYSQFSNTLQTIMVLDNPISGTWSFATEQTGEIITEFMAMNQAPSTLVEMPANRMTRDNTINLSLTDYNDTLKVKVYYDDDNQGFDGNFIQEFESLNNSEISFNWSNSDIPDGEYFIYTKIDDGVNALVLQYAPGSILVDNVNLEVPQNISYSLVDEGLEISWDAPTDNSIIVTSIDITDIYNNDSYSYCVTNANNYVIKDLPLGREYEIICRFGDNSFTMSDPSESITIQYYGNSRTSKPYFTMNGKNAWDAVVNQPLFKTLSANDFDSNNLAFHLNNAQTGMSINGYDFNWTPTLDQKGYYIQEIVVSDGVNQDTLQQQIFVYTEEQAEIKVDFSSFNLYEDDNMFVKISNLYCDEDTQTVSLLNNRTNQTTTVTCRRVNKFDYMGRFSLSVINRTSIEVQDGDAITANYVYDGQTYTNRSIYDSNPQPSDEIAPSSIADLAVESLAGNRVKLSWTSPGDDGNIGNAYKYDLRYSYTDIATSEDYLTANLITNVINPSAVGEIDSLIIDLTSLPNATDYDQLYFSIVSEDDNQNRSDISNCAYYNYLVSPASVVAEEILSDTVFVSWSDVVSLQRGRESTTFNSYNIYRLRNDFSTLIATNHNSNSYQDDISDLTDGSYQYAIEAVYNNGLSPKSYSNVLDIDRLVDVRILCQADSLAPANNVTYSILPLTSALEEEIIGTTNNSGMILIDNFHKADYSVNLSKEGCFDAEYTITINNQNNEFVLDIFSVLPPSFINIERENNNLIIEWNRVNGAKSYKIYGSSIPEPEDWGQAISVQSENSYQILDENLRFFRIISSSDDLELVRDKYNLSK